MSEASRIAALKASVAMRMHADGVDAVLERAERIDRWITQASSPGAPELPAEAGAAGPADAGKDQG